MARNVTKCNGLHWFDYGCAELLKAKFGVGAESGVGSTAVKGTPNICAELEETKYSWMGCGHLGSAPAQQAPWAQGREKPGLH